MENNQQKSEAMLTGKYFLKCEQTPCKCIDLERCDNSVLMEKRLPQPIEQEHKYSEKYPALWEETVKIIEGEPIKKEQPQVIKNLEEAAKVHNEFYQSQEQQPIEDIELEKLAEDYGNSISHDHTEQGCAISGFIAGYKAALSHKAEQPIESEDERIEIATMWCEVIHEINEADKKGMEAGEFIPTVLEKRFTIKRNEYE